MILAGDVGATKTILGLFSLENGGPKLVSQQTFRTAAHAGLTPMAREFLQRRTDIKGACFGVAGPVVDGVGEITNLSWPLEAAAIASDLELENVSLINDLVATGYGVASLRKDDFLVLNEGRIVPETSAAVISSGTGLGECILHWNGKHYVPIPTEAGHADFAPHDEVTMELARYLRRKTSTASVEQVVSGSGLINIYNFLRDAGRGHESADIQEKMRTGDPAAVIAESALNGTCELCSRALDIFVGAYGAEVGNLALRSLSLAGVYLGGGIAKKIRGRMQSEIFMKAFVNKDRQSTLLSQVPVRIILNEHTPLFGAVNYLQQNVA